MNDERDAAEVLQELITKHGLSILAQGVPERSDRDASDWDKQAVHFKVRLLKTRAGKPVTIWTGNYSVGGAWPMSWAKSATRVDSHGRTVPHRHVQNLYRRLENKFGYGQITLHDEAIMQQIHAAYARAAPLTCTQILESLISDARGSDEPFEDWAPDLGYDPDSRKAYAIWEECNNIRRILERALGAEDWVTVQGLEL